MTTTPAKEAVSVEQALKGAQEMLAKAADQFAFYADQHAKKRTKEGDEKAGTNHLWALACAKADHACRHALTREKRMNIATGVRPEVWAFAKLMEQQLRANDRKTGWKDSTARSLFGRLTEEAMELGDQLNSKHRSVVQIGLEAADVANFAMMVADVSGALNND